LPVSISLVISTVPFPQIQIIVILNIDR